MSIEKEEEVIVEIEKDEPEVKVQEAAPVEKKEEAPKEDGVEVIRAQVKEYEEKLEAERAEKEAARLRAETAEREVVQAKTRVNESEAEALNSAIAMLETEKEQAKRELKVAMESGDFDGVVSANEKLSLSVTNIEKLKEGKTALERTRTEPSDPVEGYIQRFSPRSQDFLRKNMDYVRDPVKNKKLIAAHYEAEAEGYVPDTDAYFDFLGKKLSPSQKKEISENRSAPAAPVSRGYDSISSSSSESSSVVKLTPGEARAATDGSIVWNFGPKKGEPIGVKEYARRKSVMMKQGAYSDMN